ncbi:MAG: hypothetical protein KF788_08700 [Piscinibacter sp.]|nr:hypothetical protein [Piscinibacter sp.]
MPPLTTDPLDGAALRQPFEHTAQRINRLAENIREAEHAFREREREAQEHLLDTTWSDGRDCGLRAGYVRGWRTGLIDGTLLGALLVTGALWLGNHFGLVERLQGLLQ